MLDESPATGPHIAARGRKVYRHNSRPPDTWLLCLCTFRVGSAGGPELCSSMASCCECLRGSRGTGRAGGPCGGPKMDGSAEAVAVVAMAAGVVAEVAAAVAATASAGAAAAREGPVSIH